MESGAVDNSEPGVPSRLKPLGAGEGGRLPRGLSLFRFFLFSGLMLGALYGGAALYWGAPPIPGYVGPGSTSAASWAPSPWWLPVFLGLHAGIGVEHSAMGFQYRGRAGHACFAAAAMALGVLCGGTLGWISGEQARRMLVRRLGERKQ